MIPGFYHTIPSDTNNLKDALNEALAYIAGAAPRLTLEETSDVRLVIWELLLNAAIHGNGLNPRKYVRLGIDFDGRTLRVTVEDEGEGFDYGALLAGFGTPDFESEHGRGVRLAVALMDEFMFNDMGNRVWAAKHVKHVDRSRGKAHLFEDGVVVGGRFDV